MPRDSQDSIIVCVWGFIETRNGVPRVAEARANVHDTFAAMDLMERAMELGIPPQEVRESAVVLAATDDRGHVEMRPFFLDDVDLRSTDSLFEEAEDLADAVADMLEAWSRFRDGAPSTMEVEPIRRVRAALATYDRRWNIHR